MKTTIKLMTLFLLAGIVLVSCKSSTSTDETNDVSYPFITENGVAPFILGASMEDIPYHGDYYDTIVHEVIYHVDGQMDGQVFEWNEAEFEKQKKSDSFDAYTITNTHTNSYVILGDDTIMVVSCDSDWKIIYLKIYSNKLQLENGIHTGLSSTELYSKFNAQFVCERDTRNMGSSTPPTMGYITPELPNSIGLIAAKKNNITFAESNYGDEYPIHGVENDDRIYVMPLDDVKNDYLAYIIIVENAYPELFNICYTGNGFYNMILK